MSLRVTDGEVLGKPQIYAEPHPEVAVRRALDDLGYPWATYVSYEQYVKVFTTLIEEHVKRAING
jgi:hypothetical protein